MAHKLRQAVNAPELRQPLTAGVLGKEETWPLHVSQDVSNSIDLIGNYAFDGLPACCIGCATQRRCWGGHGQGLRVLPGLMFCCGYWGVPVGRNAPSRQCGLRYCCGLRVFS